MTMIMLRFGKYYGVSPPTSEHNIHVSSVRTAVIIQTAIVAYSNSKQRAQGTLVQTYYIEETISIFGHLHVQ